LGTIAVINQAVALALGAWTGRRSLARGVTGAVAAAAYVLSSLSLIVSRLHDYRYVSPFFYAIGAEPLRNGLGPGYAVVLLATVLVRAVVAILVFERRDVSA
jgi:ABC-2 type transport system permease protein